MFTRTYLLAELIKSGLEFEEKGDLIDVLDSDMGVNTFGPIQFDGYYYCSVELKFDKEQLVNIHFTSYP